MLGFACNKENYIIYIWDTQAERYKILRETYLYLAICSTSDIINIKNMIRMSEAMLFVVLVWLFGNTLGKGGGICC